MEKELVKLILEKELISQIKFGNKRISQVNIHFANKLIEKVKEKDSGNDLKLNVYTQKRNINS